MSRRESSPSTPQPGQPAPEAISLAEEQLVIGKTTVASGGVRVHKHVTRETVPLDLPLLDEAVEVERVPVHREVERPQPVREEGDCLIIPLHEEVVVVERKLMVREELRLVRRRGQRSEHLEEQLRSEVAELEELPPKEHS